MRARAQRRRQEQQGWRSTPAWAGATPLSVEPRPALAEPAAPAGRAPRPGTAAAAGAAGRPSKWERGCARGRTRRPGTSAGRRGGMTLRPCWRWCSRWRWWLLIRCALRLLHPHPQPHFHFHPLRPPRWRRLQRGCSPPTAPARRGPACSSRARAAAPPLPCAGCRRRRLAGRVLRAVRICNLRKLDENTDIVNK